MLVSVSARWPFCWLVPLLGLKFKFKLFLWESDASGGGGTLELVHFVALVFLGWELVGAVYF